ncbi:MBG domain-containing protein, partial [Cyclobacterium sp.]|uniref:MBG domain-containing protein n=1 Tax=Cyclobacterium sp. TaxID=1966343 RepID=UPI0019B8F473
TITADNKSKVYGEANPELTFTYSGLVNGDTEVSDKPAISTTATASSNVGTYPISLTGGSDANYAITLVAGELEVTQAALTITADNKSKVYGEANPELTFTYSGLVNGDTEVSDKPAISTTATASSNVGTYPVTLTGGSDANYAITLEAGELEVTQAALTITADDKSKVYGEANPALTFTYTGLVNSDTEVSDEPSVSTTATASSNVGSYPVTLTGGSDANYAITLVAGELEVTQAALTITADDKSKVYGEENPLLTFTYTGLVNGDTEVSDKPAINTTATASSNVGTYPISLTGGSDANYAITLVAGELEVTQAALTITADNKSKVYGEANPELTFTYTGLVNGDTEVSDKPAINTTATASSSVGSYPVTLTGGSDDNYAITLVAGELEVTQAALTITADNKSKVYGEANPALTFSYTGLVNSDTEVSDKPAINTTATASSNVGSYPVTLTGGSDSNYAITLVAGELEVTQAALTITADNKSKVYGEANPALTFSYTGLVNGDTEVSDKPAISTTATASSNVGSYPVTLTGGSDSNYAITLVAGELEVTQAALTITAEDKSKVYGEANPALTFTYTGLVNGDTEVSDEPAISTTATVGSNVGTYPIALTGGSDDNYAITLIAGELEVTQAALTITADDKSKVYGDGNPALTFTYTGLVNGDTEVSDEPGIATTATASSSVGSYPVTLIGGSDDNYTITLVAGELEVTQAALTIMADDKSKVYGEANPALTFTYTGLVNGDTEVSEEPAISTTATANSNVGSYPVTLTGGSDANYAIMLEAGELEVTQAALTIMADDKSKVYGEANPALTFTYSGLVNGDTEVSEEPAISTTATANSNVGSYPVTLTGGSDANYAITLVAGELEVTQAALTITADSKSKVYGEANPALTFSYTGLVNSDTEVSDEPGIATTATESSNVGTYPVTLTGGSDANYAITLVAGELEVMQAGLTITADDKSKVYGEANPDLTFTYTGLVNGDTEVSDEPAISTTATAGSNVGTYSIALTGGSDDNYDITLEAGELEVTPAGLTITADDKSKVYGEANPDLTFTYTGLVNGDTEVSDEPAISTTATVGSNVGTYPIALTGGSDDNYAITLIAGELEVTPASLTITADDKSKVYGMENPVLTYQFQGLVNGDTEVSVLPEIVTTTTLETGVGVYPISLSGAEDHNYQIKMVAGILEVMPKTLEVKANGGLYKTFGDSDPEFTYLASGFEEKDGYEVFSGQLEREPGEAPGTYAINQGSLDAGKNYQVQFTGNQFEIIEIVVVDVLEMTPVHMGWGEAIPELPATVLVITDRDEIINLSVTWDSSVVDVLASGQYTLTGSLDLGSVHENPENQQAKLTLVIDPKQAPSNLLITNNEFEGEEAMAVVQIGELEVIDAVDDIHLLELPGGMYDNGYFEILSGQLYWNSPERAEGKTTFQVLVRVTDRDGNVMDRLLEINRIRKSISEIEVYNSFTPNGDGINDGWGVPDLRHYSGVSIQVFERSGKRVFYTQDPDHRWDGTFEGVDLPIGTYYWTVQVKETGETRKGMLNILKK